MLSGKSREGGAHPQTARRPALCVTRGSPDLHAQTFLPVSGRPEEQSQTPSFPHVFGIWLVGPLCFTGGTMSRRQSSQGLSGPPHLAGAPRPSHPTSFSCIGLSGGHRPPSAAIHDIRTVRYFQRSSVDTAAYWSSRLPTPPGPQTTEADSSPGDRTGGCSRGRSLLAAGSRARTVPGALLEVCLLLQRRSSLSFRTCGPLVARPHRTQQVREPGFSQGGMEVPQAGFEANAKRGLWMRKAFATNMVWSSQDGQGRSKSNLQTAKPICVALHVAAG